MCIGSFVKILKNEKKIQCNANCKGVFHLIYDNVTVQELTKLIIHKLIKKWVCSDRQKLNNYIKH